MKKAIATLLSLCVMFSIMTQGMIAYASEPQGSEAAVITDQRQETPEDGALSQEENPEAAGDTEQGSQQEGSGAEENSEGTSEDAAAEEQPQGESLQMEQAPQDSTQEGEPAPEADEEPEREVPTDTAVVELSVSAGLPVYREIVLNVTLSGDGENCTVTYVENLPPSGPENNG